MKTATNTALAMEPAAADESEPTILPARLLGLGSAVPELRWTRGETEASMAKLWGLSGVDLVRWGRIVAGTGIIKRHAVLPPEDVIGLSTQQRMEMYERFSPGLAAEAAGKAMRAAGVTAGEITDLVVVSCTGFVAPGVDVALVEELGIRASVRRTLVGFMGCFGGISGLRTAVGACAANRDAVVLLVCVELCSLHMRGDSSPQNQVASALFADGAAAAVLTSRENDGDAVHNGTSAAIGRVTTGASLLIPEGRDWMTWRITDTGFAMTLTRDVPVALSERLSEFVGAASPTRPACFAVHPGGPGIVDAVDEALKLDGAFGLEASRSVLRRYGNMSSATVFFVLEEALNGGCGMPVMLLAFGPGLTIESTPLLPDQRT